MGGGLVGVGWAGWWAVGWAGWWAVGWAGLWGLGWGCGCNAGAEGPARRDLRANNGGAAPGADGGRRLVPPNSCAKIATLSRPGAAGPERCRRRRPSSLRTGRGAPTATSCWQPSFKAGLPSLNRAAGSPIASRCRATGAACTACDQRRRRRRTNHGAARPGPPWPAAAPCRPHAPQGMPTCTAWRPRAGPPREGRARAARRTPRTAPPSRLGAHNVCTGRTARGEAGT